MKDYFSIGEAAKAVNMTSETLRYYDRIGLVKPSRKDEWTGYRYYTRQDIVRLNTVHALQQMDLPLKKIKQVLEYDDLERIVEFLEEAEKKADEKIAAIQYGKAKIRAAKEAYKKNLNMQRKGRSAFIREYPARVIMLSDTDETPTLDILWNYLNRFYDQIAPDKKELFEFEDLAGVYTQQNLSRMFAVCVRYADAHGLKVLPAGKYLCVDCDEENRESMLNSLMKTAKEEYNAEPEFNVQLIIVSGILQWKYQIQLYLGE